MSPRIQTVDFHFIISPGQTTTFPYLSIVFDVHQSSSGFKSCLTWRRQHKTHYVPHKAQHARHALSVLNNDPQSGAKLKFNNSRSFRLGQRVNTYCQCDVRPYCQFWSIFRPAYISHNAGVQSGCASETSVLCFLEFISSTSDSFLLCYYYSHYLHFIRNSLASKKHAGSCIPKVYNAFNVKHAEQAHFCFSQYLTLFMNVIIT